MCTLISHVHTLAFSFVNIICISCIDTFFLIIFFCTLHYICSFILCTNVYVLFIFEEIKNYIIIIIIIIIISIIIIIIIIIIIVWSSPVLLKSNELPEMATLQTCIPTRSS